MDILWNKRNQSLKLFISTVNLWLLMTGIFWLDLQILTIEVCWVQEIHKLLWLLRILTRKVSVNFELSFLTNILDWLIMNPRISWNRKRDRKYGTKFWRQLSEILWFIVNFLPVIQTIYMLHFQISRKISKLKCKKTYMKNWKVNSKVMWSRIQWCFWKNKIWSFNLCNWSILLLRRLLLDFRNGYKFFLPDFSFKRKFNMIDLIWLIEYKME